MLGLGFYLHVNGKAFQSAKKVVDGFTGDSPMLVKCTANADLRPGWPFITRGSRYRGSVPRIA
jgi:hypothetical protein